MDRPRLAPLALLTVAALVTPLSACSDDTPDSPATVTVTVDPDGDSGDADTDDGTDAPSTPASTPAADEGPLPDEGPDDDAPFVANTEPDTGAASAGALLSPTNLRFGVHDGFDRLVLDLSGDGEPGWLAEYVDTPTGQASGEVVDLEGDASLVITIQGMLLPTEPGAEPYTGPQTISPSGDGVIREVVYGSMFEGTQQIFVGVASKEPFRVYLLADPTRLVLDVQHP
jgi:hypothetical protein